MCDLKMINTLPGATIHVLLLYTAGIFCTSSSETTADWAGSIIKAMDQRDLFLNSIRTIHKKYTIENIKKSLPILSKLPSKFKNFHQVDFTTVKKHNDATALKFFKLIDEKYTIIQVRDLFHYPSDEINYRERGLGFLLSKFKSSYDTECLYQLISPPTKPRDIQMPLDKVCVGIKKPSFDYASITKICLDFNTCVQFSRGENEIKIENACTSENKCDVKKAVPKFGALLWYKISNYLARIICGKFDQEERQSEYENIERHVRLFMSYMAVTDWDGFFKNAVSLGGFSKLPRLMKLVDKRKEFMRYVSVACNELNADKMCVVSDILKQHSLLKKIENGSMASGQVRDLRMNGNINVRNLLSKKKDELRHLQILASIRSVNENLQTSVTGLSDYFKTLAKFDQDIAQADVGYIDGKLTEFRTKITGVEKTLQSDVDDLIKIVQSALVIKLASEVVRLSAVIAQNSNPFKVMFSGVDVDAIYERTVAVAAATADVATASALARAITNIGKDSLQLMKKFQENREQLDSLTNLVEIIKNGTTEQIKEHADKFVEQYGAYTPKVKREELSKNAAKWSSFKNTACDLLPGADGSDIEIQAGRIGTGSTLICEHLEGTLAEFFTLREAIFDFQFDLVDSLTKIIRGNIAQKLASSIKTKNKVLDVFELTRGFFMEHYRLQSNIYLYCNIIQYKNHGKRNELCPKTGFFDYNKLDELTEIKDPPYYKQERFGYIPTSPEHPGDTGYINLHSLAAGNQVIFQLPRNRSWLMENKWITCNDVIAPFVTSIKVYLPLGDYKDVQKKHTITTTTITNDLGSYPHYSKDVRYILPINRGSYVTTYEEGYHGCPVREMKDPYGRCDRIPNICDSTTQDVAPILRPTILSTWKLSYTITSGARRLPWIAPKPAGKLYLKAKVSLLMVHDRSIKCESKYGSRARGGDPVTCCRHGNQYFVRWKNICVDCPTNSTSRLGGYYCERNE